MSDCRNPHLSAYERAAQEDRERSADSREKLEADVDAWCAIFPTWRYAYDFRRQVLGWLDRQVAITRAECSDEYINSWDEGSVAWLLRQYEDEKLMRDVDCDMHVLLETEGLEDKIAELQEKVDELEAENARLRSRISDDSEYGRLVMGAYRELRAKLDEIAKVVDA